MATDAIDCSVPGVLALLGDALSADARRRERGEAALLSAMKRADGALKSLLAIACGGWTETVPTMSASDAEAVRTLACVTVKRRCTPRAFASRLTRGERDEAKRALLDRAMTAESKALRNAVLDVIAKIARLDRAARAVERVVGVFGAVRVARPRPAHRALAFELVRSASRRPSSGALSHHFRCTLDGIVRPTVSLMTRTMRCAVRALRTPSGRSWRIRVGRARAGRRHEVVGAARPRGGEDGGVEAGDEESALRSCLRVLDALTESRTSALSGHVPAVVELLHSKSPWRNAIELGTRARRRALDVAGVHGASQTQGADKV